MAWHGMAYLQDLIYLCCQIIKVLNCDQLALHKPQLPIAVSNRLLCCTLTVQQIYCKLSWQVDLHHGKGLSNKLHASLNAHIVCCQQ